MAEAKNVLVIGGNGFLGSNIVAELHCQGHLVSVLDIQPPRLPLEGVHYSCGNVGDQDLMQDIMRGIDCIVYLKSSTTPATSMQDAAKAYREDLPELMSTCDLCRRQGIGKIIFASSGGTVYGGRGLLRPYQETDPTHPRNHYGIAKVAAENILLMYNALHGMENIILRIANPYGYGQSSRSGVGAITAFAEKIMNDEAIQIFGDGNIVRDYIEVSDVAKAFAVAALAVSGEELPIFNIGSGRGFSLIQIVDLLQEILAMQAKIQYLPRRDFDVAYNVLDNTKAKRLLGFEPQLSPEAGIRSYVQRLKQGRGLVHAI